MLRTMKRFYGLSRFVLVWAMVGMWCCAAVAQSSWTDASASGSEPGSYSDVLRAVAPSLVQVEYTFRFDKGDPPQSIDGDESFADSIHEERPYIEAGYLISNDLVATSDLMISSRFIERIEVRYRGETRKAEIDSVAANQRAIVLRLATPLIGAKPLRFDVSADPPFYIASQGRLSGSWSQRIFPFANGLVHFGNGDELIPLNVQGTVVTRDGTAVGVTLSNELPAAGSFWKGNPVDRWNLIGADDIARRSGRLQTEYSRGVARVAVRFRSPKKNNSDAYSSYFGDDSDSGASITEWNGLGLVIDPTNVLVLADLDPKATVRLEKVSIFLRDDDGTETEHVATFRGSIKNYGAMMVTLTKPVSDPMIVHLSEVPDMLAMRDRAFLADQIIIRGETRRDFYSHGRYGAFSVGWKGRIYSENPSSRGKVFYFDVVSGELVAFPMNRRSKVSDDEDTSTYNNSDDLYLYPPIYMKEVLADPESFFDPNNTPLSEEAENRLAWFGVELQPLDRELARYNNISDETDDGRFGAIITYLYPGSPAVNAELKTGDILVRIASDDLPKPVEIDVSGGYIFASQGFPWDGLDEVPEEYFDQIPTPWVPVNSELNKTLTAIGIGTPVSIEYVRDGKIQSVELTIEQSPPYYDSAAKFEDEELGLAVRNTTYEVRRYFRKKEGDPGVIVSKIEPGSKVAVAGLKPFEIVTAVNDQPVPNIDDFKRLVEGEKELRFSVTRMTRGRIVKVTRE